MKSERRHELKHNELSDWLGEHLASYQPHATAILLGGVALFAALIVAFVVALIVPGGLVLEPDPFHLLFGFVAALLVAVAPLVSAPVNTLASVSPLTSPPPPTV